MRRGLVAEMQALPEAALDFTDASATLTDVDVTTATPRDGETLVWNGPAAKWQPGSRSDFPVVILTRAAYQALTPKLPTTVYVVTT